MEPVHLTRVSWPTPGELQSTVELSRHFDLAKKLFILLSEISESVGTGSVQRQGAVYHVYLVVDNYRILVTYNWILSEFGVLILEKSHVMWLKMSDLLVVV